MVGNKEEGMTREGRQEASPRNAMEANGEGIIESNDGKDVKGRHQEVIKASSEGIKRGVIKGYLQGCCLRDPSRERRKEQMSRNN